MDGEGRTGYQYARVSPLSSRLFAPSTNPFLRLYSAGQQVWLFRLLVVQEGRACRSRHHRTSSLSLVHLNSPSCSFSILPSVPCSPNPSYDSGTPWASPSDPSETRRQPVELKRTFPPARWCLSLPFQPPSVGDSSRPTALFISSLVSFYPYQSCSMILRPQSSY